MRIAVCGLGNMGRSLATRLLDAGYQLAVWNRTPERAQELVAAGATRADSPATAARDAELVFTSLADDDALRAVCLGADGLAASLGPGALLIDTSTVAPQTTHEVAQAASGRFIDSPILGAPRTLIERTATLFLGGDEAHLDRVEPVLAEFSAQRVRCGPVGAGVTVKVIANLLSIGQLSVWAEAVATAQASGVSGEMISWLGRSSLLPPALQNRFADMVNGDHQGWFSMRLGRKDLQLAERLAATTGLDLIVAKAAVQLFTRGIEQGYGALDIAAVVEAARAQRRASSVG